MSSVLESISMFPYIYLWRIGGKSEVNYKFGGCVSLLLIAAIGAIAVSKLISVSKMTNIIVNQQNQISFFAPMMNLTTSYADPSMEQYMFALKTSVFNDESPFTDDEYSFYGFYSIQSYDPVNKSYNYNNSYFYLQKCTAQHFYKLPDVNQNFKNWGMDAWWCLPINKTYEVGGSSLGDYKYLAITLQCLTTECQNSQYKSVVVHAFTYNTFVNPTNGTDPFTSYINKYETIFQSFATSRTFFYLQKSSLTTDRSLLPYAQKSTRYSVRTTDNFISNTYANVKSPSTYFYICHSGITVNYNRSYQKLLDAFAYIGGIFNALLGAFFFMNTFGCLFFEMDFATRFFQQSELSKVTFLTPVKQIIYKILVSFNRRPDWQFSKKVQEFKITVNNLLDIVYLQKRLQFLEKGMQILLDKHHLKGLYLTRHITREEADLKYQDHKLKNKFIRFATQKQPKQENHTSEIKMDQRINFEEIKKGSNQSKQKINSEYTNTQHQLRKDNYLNKQKLSHSKNGEKVKQNKEITAENQIIGICHNKQVTNLQKDSEEERLSEQDIFSLIRLYRQAKYKKGDSRSRKIFEQLDSQLREKLQTIARTSKLPNLNTIFKL